MKEFSLGAVLTVTTGRLLCDIGELYQIIDYMTDTPHFTHQLPRAADACKPYILQQHPFLMALHPPADAEAEEILSWFREVEDAHGDTLEVQPMPAGEYQPRNMLTELMEMMTRDD